MSKLFSLTDNFCRWWFAFGWSDFFTVKHKTVERSYDWTALAVKNKCKCGVVWFSDYDELRKSWENYSIKTGVNGRHTPVLI